MPTHGFISLFNADPLAAIVIILVGFISLIVALFSVRYMEGDSQYTRFFYLLAFIVISLMCMAAADNLFILLGAWAISNFILVRLMVHKRQWQAAANAGWLASKTFLMGLVCLAIAFVCLYLCTGKTSIHAILSTIDVKNPLAMIATLLIMITAMTQSAIWPFHKWLLSSLNSPTPVSAIMHAGLVNGGGVLLSRFAPLYLSQSNILLVIFLIGISSAYVGSFWKLMQSDIKRMLACSTMAQMGFMFAQCGLGLFPAAVAHLCWHGLFKANLFLVSNSVQQEKRFSSGYPPKINQLVLALLCGAYASFVFTRASHQVWIPMDSSLILVSMVFIAASQFALTFIQNTSLKSLSITLVIISIVSALYGFSIFVIEKILSPLHLMQPQPLHIVYILGLALAISMWGLMLFKDKLLTNSRFKATTAWFYVTSLNASQAHESTITSQRRQYQYE